MQSQGAPSPPPPDGAPAGSDGRGGGEDGDDADDAADADAVEVFSELTTLLEEASIQELPEARRSTLAAQDTLTAQPGDDDEVLFALPVCAPYSALSSYKYKMKLTPGTQKKGKAAKQAIGMLSAAAGSRERELMRAVTDDELVRGLQRLRASGLLEIDTGVKTLFDVS